MIVAKNADGCYNPFVCYTISKGTMSVRIVRTKNGEDIIADLFEVTTKEDPEKPVAFQLRYPYNVWLENREEPELLMEVEGQESLNKNTNPNIRFEPWAPLSKDRSIMIKLDEVVSAYETYPEVEEKYNKIVEAESGRGNAATGASFDPPQGSTPVSVGSDN